MSILVVIGLSYLIGSIPAGYLAGRVAGVDIRNAGSGNIGATNVLRVLGKAYGYPVFLFDFLKGVAAVKLSILVFDHGYVTIGRDLCVILGGASSVIGHSYPVWLRFKGGKGVATSLGVLFGLSPLVALILMIVWVITFAVTRYVSVASMTTAVVLPLATGTLLYLRRVNEPTLFYFSLFLTAIVIWRHRSNLSRLTSGTEPRFNRK